MAHGSSLPAQEDGMQTTDYLTPESVKTLPGLFWKRVERDPEKRAYRYYDKFREQSKFSTLMYRVAINTAITNFKKEAKTRKKSEIGKELYLLADEPYDYEREEHLNLLHEAINQLTGIEKSITLLYLEDKPYEEISDITGISQNYVRVKMNRIKKKLESFVKNKEGN